jgi:hypothetical protein
VRFSDAALTNPHETERHFGKQLQEAKGKALFLVLGLTLVEG